MFAKRKKYRLSSDQLFKAKQLDNSDDNDGQVTIQLRREMKLMLMLMLKQMVRLRV